MLASYLTRRRSLVPLVLAALLATSACGSGSEQPKVNQPGGGSSSGTNNGAGGSGTDASNNGTDLDAGSADGGEQGSEGDAGNNTTGNNSGEGPRCQPGERRDCYRGAEGTLNVGTCKAGSEVCLEDGSGYGPCEGQVVPRDENCATPENEDCDGQSVDADAGCACAPGEALECYGFADGTAGLGICAVGRKTCNADGTGWGSCEGDVGPAVEDCATGADDDCDGEVNEGCTCVPNTSVSCYGGPRGTEGIGECKAGSQTCSAGGVYGGCEGQVLPQPEICGDDKDSDCDGNPDNGCICIPGDRRLCYSGPEGTANVGVCKSGVETCNAQGTAWSRCEGEVLPGLELCGDRLDNDCDSENNEADAGCCTPNELRTCYSGPRGTEGEGICTAGTQSCVATGDAWTVCLGEVLPEMEICGDRIDNDCNGSTDERGCAQPPASWDTHVKPIFQIKCNGCHTLSYEFSQTSGRFSGCTAGTTWGACAQERILSGSMPQGTRCSGDPAMDVNKPACLTQAEHDTLQSWIDGGQQR